MKVNQTSSQFKSRTGSLLLTGLIAFMFTSGSFGQTTITAKPPFKERLFFGGNIALQVGTATSIEILPVAGLWVLPRIAVALGPGYRFYSYQSQHTSIYSFRTYLQFVAIRDIDKLIPAGVHTSIILQVEDEAMSLDSKYWHNVDLEPNRFWVNSAMAGPGISQQIGKRSSLTILVLWALNDTGYELYGNPVVRIGVVF